MMQTHPDCGWALEGAPTATSPLHSGSPAASAAPAPAPWEPSGGACAGGPLVSVAVCCGALEGLMLLPSRTILLGAGTGAEREVTPNEFERLGGKGGSKKWRRSIQLVDGACEIGEWLRERGYDGPCRGGPGAGAGAGAAAAHPGAAEGSSCGSEFAAAAPVDHAQGARSRAASFNGSACSAFTAAAACAAAEPAAAAAVPPPAFAADAVFAAAEGVAAGDEVPLPTDSNLHQMVVRQQLRLLQAQRAVLELCQERFANDGGGGGEERARLLADTLQMQKQVAQQQQLLHTLARRRWRRPVGPAAQASAPAAAATHGLAAQAQHYAGGKHARCAEGPAAACRPNDTCGSAPAAAASMAPAMAGAVAAAAPVQAPLPGDGSDAVAAMAAHLAGAAPLPPPHLLPFAAPPAVAGRPVDLRALFTAVTSRGGYQAVTVGHRWGEVLAELGLSGPLPDCRQAEGPLVLLARLHSVYLDFLLRFERMFDHEAWLRLTGRPTPVAAFAPARCGGNNASGFASAQTTTAAATTAAFASLSEPAPACGPASAGPLPWARAAAGVGAGADAPDLPSNWADALLADNEPPAKRRAPAASAWAQPAPAGAASAAVNAAAGPGLAALPLDVDIDWSDDELALLEELCC